MRKWGGTGCLRVSEGREMMRWRETGALIMMVLAIAGGASAAEEAHPGIISLNPFNLSLQVINFLLLVVVLYKFGFKRLTDHLQKRAREIRDSLEQAQQARAAAAKAQEEYRAQIAATQREAAALRERTLQEVEEERQRLLSASREEAARLTAAARQEIAREVQRAKAQLTEEAVSLSLAVAEKVIDRSLTDADHKRMAEQYVREVGGIR